MAKKKLLNEAVVRRFMGLAGMESTLVSNAINEMYSMSEEDEELDAEAGEEPMDAEAGEEMDLGEPEAEEPMDAEPMDAEPMGDEAPAEEEGVVNLDQELVDDLMAAKETINAVAAALGGDAEPAMGDMEMAPEPAMDDEPMDDEPMGDEDMLEGIELELSEDEVVQEVARRVAKRILKAKKAKAQLDEALGRKPRK